MAVRFPVIVRSLLVVLVCVALGVSPGATADEVIDRVLAVAEGDLITLSDVRIARELGRVQVEGTADPVAATLDLLIERALILGEADRLAPPEPTAEAIDAALALQFASAGSRAAFHARLARLGVDEPFVRELLREDLRIRAYLDQRFSAESTEEQRRLVSAWVSSLRRRSEVVNLYESVSEAAPETAPPARD